MPDATLNAPPKAATPPRPAPRPRCDSCPFFDPTDGAKGLCRIEPPTFAGSPPTVASSFCGKHPQFNGWLKAR